jgi:hypothetical protein
MTLAETMTAIEHDHFAAEMNLAAGTKAFLRMMRDHSLFHHLTALTRQHPEVVAARTEQIAAIEIDERYENPLDTALSAYVLALLDSNVAPEIVSKAAQAVFTTPKCWWSLGVARDALLKTAASGPQVTTNQTPRDRAYRILINSLATSSMRGNVTISELMKSVSGQQPTGKKSFGEPIKGRVSNISTSSKYRLRKYAHHQAHSVTARARMRA